jgi:hypothetical protein
VECCSPVDVQLYTGWNVSGFIKQEIVVQQQGVGGPSVSIYVITTTVRLHIPLLKKISRMDDTILYSHLIPKKIKIPTSTVLRYIFITNFINYYDEVDIDLIFNKFG